MAELTFNSPIRRDKWPRWMIKLHESLKKIYEIPVEEVEPDDYDRLKRIIFEKLVTLRKDRLMMKDTNIFIYTVKGENGFGVVVDRNSKKVITYYLE